MTRRVVLLLSVVVLALGLSAAPAQAQPDYYQAEGSGLTLGQCVAAAGCTFSVDSPICVMWVTPLGGGVAGPAPCTIRVAGSVGYIAPITCEGQGFGTASLLSGPGGPTIATINVLLELSNGFMAWNGITPVNPIGPIPGRQVSTSGSAFVGCRALSHGPFTGNFTAII